MALQGAALWLPDLLRDFGLPVRVVPGWQERGRPGGRFRGVVTHHIGIAGGGDSPGLGVVTHGRPDLRNALCNVHTSRSGVPTVVAAGVAWHAGTGGYAGLQGNDEVLGNEVEGTTGEPLTSQQRGALPLITAALLEGLRTDETRSCQHYEWAPGRKVDLWAVHDPHGFRLLVGHQLRTHFEEDDVPAPTDVTASLSTPSGKGRWLLQYDGGIITEGDAPFYGSYPSLPATARQGRRGFYVLTVRDDGRAGYMLVGTDRSHYRFGP